MRPQGLAADFFRLLRAGLGGRVAPVTRRLPWVPVATIEDGSEGFPEEQWLTAERLAAMAASFDPRVFSPPVVFVPPGAIGPAHQIAERFPPPGRVAAEMFDGAILWQQWDEFVDPDETGSYDRPGRITKLNADGFGKRSIGFFPGNFPGSGAWRTRHLLITGEPEGQQALPPLDDYLPAAGRSAAALPFAARTFDLDPEPAPAPQEEAPMALSPEDLAAIGDAVAGRVQQEVAAAVAPAVTAAVAPALERLAAAETALAAERTARETAAAESLRADMAGRLQALQEQGRVPAGEVESELAALLALPVDGRTARLTALTARAPMIPVNQVPRVTVGERHFVCDPDLAGLPSDVAGRVMECRVELAQMTEAERTGPKGQAAFQKMTAALQPTGAF